MVKIAKVLIGVVIILILIMLIILNYDYTDDNDKVRIWYMELNWEAIAGFLGVGAAAIAAYFAYKSYRLADITSRNSLRPYLNILAEYESDDIDPELNKNVTFKISNKGVGPAILKKLIIHYYFLFASGNVKYVEFVNLNDFIAFIKKEPESVGHLIESATITSHGNLTLSAGEDFRILRFGKSTKTQLTESGGDIRIMSTNDFVNFIQSKLTFTIVYESVFEDTYTYSTLPNAPSPTKP